MNKRIAEKKPPLLININFLLGDSIGRYLIYLLAISVFILPILHVYIAEDSIFHVSSYTISLLGKYLCFALLALSLDLVWGYTGILSLGHGAFFGLGGYMMGMHLMREMEIEVYMEIRCFRFYGFFKLGRTSLVLVWF